MGLHAFTGSTLASLRTVELSPLAWPFEHIAPIAAYVFSRTSYRDHAQLVFENLKARRFEPLKHWESLEGLVRGSGEGALAGIYHRALLDTLAPRFPQATLERTARSYFYVRVGGLVDAIAVGEQCGMLAVFPCSDALSLHLERELIGHVDGAARRMDVPHGEGVASGRGDPLRRAGSGCDVAGRTAGHSPRTKMSR